mgnify:CR=1 FL=1
MKRLICTAAVLLALCVPVHAEDNGLSMDEAMSIILSHHGVETDMNVADYLTLDAEAMTREATVAAVIRSYGIYPADEADYVWADECEQEEQYQPYIDYAQRMGITVGIGNECFAPKRSVTEWELRTMLDRADGIEPEYPISYDSPLCKLLSADIQRGLSMSPAFLVYSFYKEGRTITAATNPIVLDNGDTLPERYIGWIWYEGDMWIAVNCNGHPCYDQDMAVIHELGHYLGHCTKLLNRYSVVAERDWLMEFFRDYCNESSHEFFADSFVAYILWPEEMAANAPTVYRHIETCLHDLMEEVSE